MIVMAMVLIASALWVTGPVATGGLGASGHTAVRSFSSEWVAPGGEITVTITAKEYGPFAQVQETLPEGFSFLGASLSNAAVSTTGDTVKFTLLGDEQFTYTATATGLEGEYEFSGVLLDSFKNEEPIGESINLRVGAAPTPVPEPTPTPTLTPTPEPAATPTLEPTPTPEPTATPMPEPTPTPEPTSTPSLTPTLEPTATAIHVPTATATATPASTATVMAMATATATPVPTVTPTATPTPEPTALPAPQPAPSETPTGQDDGGIPGPFLGIILAVIGAWVLAAGVALIVFARRQRRWPWSLFPMRRREPTPPPDPDGEP